MALPLAASISDLPYIGSYFTQKFRNEGINTLGDLVNLTQNQSKVQNIRFLRKVLTNPRKELCVGEPRYNPETQTYEKYCVRRENRYGWRSVVNYLLEKGISQNKLPLASPERGNKENCKGKCEKEENPIALFPQRFERIPNTAHEHGVIYLLRNKNRATSADDLWNKTKNQHNIAQRNFTASIRANTYPKGRQLFTYLKNDNKYQIRTKTFNKLTKLNTREDQLKYLRKL